MDNQTCRFEDWYRYDPINDRQVVRLLATTGKGTYNAEFAIVGAQALREKRKRFREYVIDCLEKGIEPHEVDMDDN